MSRLCGEEWLLQSGPEHGVKRRAGRGVGSEEEKKLQLEKDLAARLGSAGWAADRLRQQKVHESRREKAGGEARRSRV